MLLGAAAGAVVPANSGQPARSHYTAAGQLEVVSSRQHGTALRKPGAPVDGAHISAVRVDLALHQCADEIR